MCMMGPKLKYFFVSPYLTDPLNIALAKIIFLRFGKDFFFLQNLCFPTLDLSVLFLLFFNILLIPESIDFSYLGVTQNCIKLTSLV